MWACFWINRSEAQCCMIEAKQSGAVQYIRYNKRCTAQRSVVKRPINKANQKELTKQIK